MFKYVEEKYGVENIVRISTVGTHQAKQALKAACRIIECAYDKCNIIQDLTPITNSKYERPLLKLGDMLSHAYDNAEKENISDFTKEDLAEVIVIFGEELVTIALKYAQQLVGMPTTLGIHAAGCIIADKPVTEYAPVRTTEMDGEIITAIESDMIQAEDEYGLLKMDFLGLTTLDIIDECIKQIKSNTGKDIDITKIPLDNKAVYENIFEKGKTTGVFQFESEGMRAALAKLKPRCFEDIVLMNAIFRPGPLQYLDDIINTKNQGGEIPYIHPKLKDILDITYGKPVYQEQIMQIFNKVAGFSLAESDNIRRYMSKKKVDKFMSYKETFIEGLIKDGTIKEEAEEFWEQLLEFSKYSFNKSHSAAYSLIAYRCAWLKFYFPKEFACATLAFSDVADTELKQNLIKELKEAEIKVVTPDFRSISLNAQIIDDNSITIGLNNIKGISGKTAEKVIEERDNLEDFNTKTVLDNNIEKTAMEALTKVGAFDFTGIRRFEIMNILSIIREQKPKEKLNEKEEEKEIEIQELYDNLAVEAGLDINIIKSSPGVPAQLNKISDSVYNTRLKNIKKAKEELKKIREEIRERNKTVSQAITSLSLADFRISMEDKKQELETAGMFLGQTPIDMINTDLFTDYEIIYDLADATYDSTIPVLVTGGKKAVSKNGKEYIRLTCNGETVFVFDTDIQKKAIDFGMLNTDIFSVFLMKIRRKDAFLNALDIIDELDITKESITIAIKKKEQLPVLKQNPLRPLKVFIEEENRFISVIGDVVKGDHIKVLS